MFFVFQRQWHRRLFSTKNQTPWSFKEASEWINKFNKDKIPQDQLRIHFSRSSGPGGQNVNKVSTKVDMRLRIAEGWLPSYAINKLKLNKSSELVVTSDRTRSQAKNIQDCYEKLVDTIKLAVEVQKEPDQATLNRLAAIRQEGNKRRKENKKRNSDKKSSRRSKGYDY
ncbi:hypothetical protein BDA99DRAFT_511996 [Phascolomyces articulosus]|uniref:Prokaryotic-type class I peptide chain release factors domain-containing protein n=1 Tax=Phascolomyces articulosus TaxID=60185 RepID=A0AAD5PF66_9FUNG|nr:hypothetical protein BDA99DRAFT_511996 [Phascolomyces articulosus]